MAKVKKEVVEAAVIKFIDLIAETMPSTTYKFFIGSASALITMKNNKIINDLLNNVVDAEGYVETELIKTVLDSGFKTSGDKIQLELFNDKSSLLSIFIKPLTLTITKSDIDAIFKEINDTAVQNVSLSQVTAKS